MAKLSQLNLPVKDESTGVVTDQTFDIGGADYTAGYGIDISNDTVSTKTFTGTTAQWEALTSEQQAAYTFVNITDDSSAVAALSGLDDVTITSPSDGQTLVYDGTNNEWVNGQAASGLELGETSTTAYRGDRGKIAYDTSLENKDAIEDINNALPSVPGDSWEENVFTGPFYFNGSNIWTDGDNIYYSDNATQYVLDKSTSTWSKKTWTGLTSFRGYYIWTDGDNIYYSNSSTQYVLDKETSTWSTKTWTGLTSFNGSYIWTDGDNIYYSNGSTQCVLDKSTSTWSTKTWTGLTNFSGEYIWTDGDNIYYSYYYSSDSTQYVLDKSTSTWSAKTWTGLTSLKGVDVWTDGTNIYYSNSSTQYVLDKETSAWSIKTWTCSFYFYGNSIWTDGDNIYYSQSTTQCVLDKSTSTWFAKTWTGRTSFSGDYIWTDGDYIYYSSDSTQYVLDKSTSTWSTKTWTGLTYFSGEHIWTDGTNIYYSNNTTQYVLDKSTSTWSKKTWTGLTNFRGLYIWTDGTNIYYSNNTTQYVLNKSTSTWSKKTWTGLTSFMGSYVWTDGTDIYYSDNATQYVLDKSTSTWSAKTWAGHASFRGSLIWNDGNNIYASSTSYQYVLSKNIISLGTSATKDFTTSVSSGSEDLVTSGAVYNAIATHTPVVMSTKINAGNTDAIFTNVPTTGNWLVSVHTSDPEQDYDSVDKSIPGTLIYTFAEQESTLKVYLRLEKVLVPKPKLVPWSTGTDAEIKAMVDAYYDDVLTLDEIQSVWNIGDEREVTLSAMAATGVGESHASQTVKFVIMNWGGKTLSDNTECLSIVGQKNSLSEAGYMNSSNTNTGGWNSSARRTWCNNVYKEAIPSDFRALFKEHNNQSGTGDGSSSGTQQTTDYFALPAEIEVFGSLTCSVAGEGNQFKYYETSANRGKTLGEGGSASHWWERSPYSGNATAFCIVEEYKTALAGYASTAYGLAPFGCI